MEVVAEWGGFVGLPEAVVAGDGVAVAELEPVAFGFGAGVVGGFEFAVLVEVFWAEGAYLALSGEVESFVGCDDGDVWAECSGEVLGEWVFAGGGAAGVEYDGEFLAGL